MIYRRYKTCLPCLRSLWLLLSLNENFIKKRHYLPVLKHLQNSCTCRLQAPLKGLILDVLPRSSCNRSWVSWGKELCPNFPSPLTYFILGFSYTSSRLRLRRSAPAFNIFEWQILSGPKFCHLSSTSVSRVHIKVRVLIVEVMELQLKHPHNSGDRFNEASGPILICQMPHRGAERSQ